MGSVPHLLREQSKLLKQLRTRYAAARTDRFGCEKLSLYGPDEGKRGVANASR